MLNSDVKALILASVESFSTVPLTQALIDAGVLKLTQAKELITSPSDDVQKEFESKYFIDKTKNSFEPPYIAREYYDHTFGIGKDVKIGFYVDTFEELGFREIEHNVFKINSYVDHVLHKVFYLRDGSHILNLGVLPEGEHVIAFEAIDIYGRKSFRDYFEIRVKNLDAVIKYQITQEDLDKYGVKTNEEMDSTEQVNLMWEDLSKEYNYLIMPQEVTIYSDMETSFIIPNKTTIDLNQSTLKLLPGRVGDKCTQFKFLNGNDMHLINGYIEGDKDTHDYTNSPNNSEWLLGYTVNGRAKYSSIENVKVNNITGYGMGAGFGADRDNSGYLWAWIGASKGTCEVKPGPIFKYTPGSLIDISKFKVDGCNNFSFGRYLGYQGNPSQWYYRVYFYDENRNKVDDLVGMFYRRVFIPDNVKYAQFDVMGNEQCGWWIDDFKLWSFKVPVNFENKNVWYDNCRCVGAAPGACESIRYIDCEWSHSGYNAARCAFDSEDGWEMMHDFYFTGCNFHDNPNNDWLTCAGLNFLLENNKFDDGSMYVWSRTDGIVIRNNKLNGSITATKPSYDTRNPYKVYNNEVTGSISIPTSLGFIKNCKAKSISGKVI